jgi:hypothetical protein
MVTPSLRSRDFHAHLEDSDEPSTVRSGYGNGVLLGKQSHHNEEKMSRRCKEGAANLEKHHLRFLSTEKRDCSHLFCAKRLCVGLLTTHIAASM